MQAVNVLKNVGLAVGDEDNVELIQWLVHKAHIVLFDSGVLGTGIREFGERCEEGLNSGASNLPELARKDGLSSTSAYRGCENDLCVAWASQLWALPEPRERESKIEGHRPWLPFGEQGSFKTKKSRRRIGRAVHAGSPCLVMELRDRGQLLCSLWVARALPLPPSLSRHLDFFSFFLKRLSRPRHLEAVAPLESFMTDRLPL